MTETTLSLQEIQRLRSRVATLRGRNWDLGFQLIEALDPVSRVADLALR